MKNSILDRRKAEREATAPRDNGKDDEYDKKVIGVVVSAVGIFIILASWAIYDQSRRKAADAADRARLVGGASTSELVRQKL